MTTVRVFSHENGSLRTSSFVVFLINFLDAYDCMRFLDVYVQGTGFDRRFSSFKIRGGSRVTWTTYPALNTLIPCDSIKVEVHVTAAIPLLILMTPNCCMK